MRCWQKPEIFRCLPRCDSTGVRSASARGRITLDLVVDEYENGMTPEEIVRAYDTLNLSDVYAAIADCLRDAEEVGST